MSKDANPNVTLGEQADLIEADVEVQLSEALGAVRDRLIGAFGELTQHAYRGELTLEVDAARIVDVVAFCKDEVDLRCELLADLSAVHWPGGAQEATAQETTGWPTYTEEHEGRIEVDLILYSLAHGHRFRLRVNLPDEDPRMPSVTSVYAAANFMEREVYDFFGVVFEGHPNLTRIEMPDDWEGHPQRKDYPLGGVEVMYHGATIPPPDERTY